MKKISFILVIFLLASSFVHGQQGNIFQHRLGPQTEAAFLAVCRRISSRPLLRGNFEQEKFISSLNRSLRSSGNFIISAGQGMVWDTVRPFPSTLTLGKDFIIQSRPGGQKTALSAQGNETFLRLADVISSVFTGNARGLLDNFEVYYLERNSSWEMALIPFDRAINTFANIITMNGDAVIRFIHITEQNNDTISYTLTNHNFPEALNTSENAHFSLP